MKAINVAPERMLRWYLALTKPSAEALAKWHLERQGYRVYSPLLQQRILRRGKWKDQVTALFPRYVFVQLDAALQSLAPVRSTIGIAGVVRFGCDYAVVPNRVVECLLKNEDSRTGLHTMRAGRWFAPGMAVRIATGALSGLEGVFVCEEGSDRVTVLLNLLGRESSVKIDARCLVPCAA